MSQTVSGHCYCGGVRFTVAQPADEPPVFTAYCHCDSCRRAHAAPLYQVVAVRPHNHRITAGAALVREFQHAGRNIVRAFCSQCGSRLYNRLSALGDRSPIIFFPDLIDEDQRRSLPAVFRPRINNAAGECVLDADKLAEVLA